MLVRLEALVDLIEQATGLDQFLIRHQGKQVSLLNGGQLWDFLDQTI
jgi:hypothetical protein